MVRYSRLEDETKVARSRGERLRCRFKKTREVGAAIKGMDVDKAIAYLEAVIEGKRGVACRRYTGGISHHGPGKNVHAPGNAVAFPAKPAKHFIELLKNIKANAETKALGDKLKIAHVQVNAAIKMRRRTYRAHGRIGPYQATPSHIEIIARPADYVVEKPVEEEKKKRLSRKAVARLRLRLPNGTSA